MLEPKIGRVAAAALCVVALAAGCDSSDDGPDQPDGGTISVTTMRGALLQASDVGGSWAAPEASTDAQRLVPLCGGAATAPPVPPGAEVVSAPLADEGTKGAQTLNQTALVYGDATGAQAALASLRAVADKCPATVSQGHQTTADRNEPAYTETAKTQDINEGGWSGFVITRHKVYEAKHPGTADVAVSVVSKSNVLVVEGYAVYRLGNASGSPQFDTDWKKLLGTVLNRVG
ncbi:hypothetical protein [Actinoplanes sp. NPDC089786]|uniref:hypothetical protein n=1 Tax=Actinoplanes sp. NPDC089786 TaxID=3155185 RepID=UPI00342193B8